MPEFEAVKSDADFTVVASLAREIWTEHYTPIIGRRQVEYMLNKFQSASAIAQQVLDGYRYYLVHQVSTPVGYFALVPDGDGTSALLSKIYVRKEQRGEGIGRAMIQMADRICAELGIKKLWLTVNRHNSESIAWYERVGFVNKGPIVQDIGDGFVMDDYMMERTVTGS